MSKLYRYKPADNRTPVHHPTIGHLEYGKTYDHPDCAGRPDFEEVKATTRAAKKAAGRRSDRRPAAVRAATEAPEPADVPESPVSEAEPGTPENPDWVATGDPQTPFEPPAEQADAGDAGRSE